MELVNNEIDNVKRLEPIESERAKNSNINKHCIIDRSANLRGLRFNPSNAKNSSLNITKDTSTLDKTLSDESMTFTMPSSLIEKMHNLETSNSCNEARDTLSFGPRANLNKVCSKQDLEFDLCGTQRKDYRWDDDTSEDSEQTLGSKLESFNLKYSSNMKTKSGLMIRNRANNFTFRIDQDNHSQASMLLLEAEGQHQLQKLLEF